MLLDLGKEGEMFVGLAVGALLKQCISMWMRHHRNQKFERVGTVSRLYCYPVKSCQPVELAQAEISPRGITSNGMSDRHWMVANAKNQFMSQRTLPAMALIKVSDSGDSLQLDAPGMQTIRVPKRFAFKKTDIKPCSVNKYQPVEGVDCGDDVARWVSDYLKTNGLRFIAFMDGLEAKDCTNLNKPWTTQAVKGDRSAYSDYCPYMVMTEASVSALNERLQEHVTVMNFRPNILVSGTQAFEEDNWEELMVGDTVRMRCLDPCTRCLMTTVNPLTGVKSAVGEPLNTLKKFRSFPEFGPSPCFGVDLAADVFGNVKVGDPVYAIRKSKNDLP